MAVFGMPALCSSFAHFLDMQTLCVCRNSDICTTLVGMPTSQQVHANVQTTLEAVGLVETPDSDKEAAVLQEIQRILGSIKDVCWPSGRPENN